MGCGGSKGGSGGGSGSRFQALDGLYNVEKQEVGEGATASVYLCKSVKTGERAACKVMRFEDAQMREEFEHELSVWKAAGQHRNIIDLLHSAIDKDGKHGYMVMRACTGGELFDRIANKTNRGSECDAAMGVLDVLTALTYLHSKRIIHRDLKPENLLYRDKDLAAPLILIDFGIAEKLGPGKDYHPDVIGTTAYMSPECLEGKGGMPADLWSLGVIVYFMLSGTLPFPGRSDEEKEDNIFKGLPKLEGAKWSKVSSEGKDFIKKLVCPVSKRMTAEQALAHPWITNRTKLAEFAIDDEVSSALKVYAESNRFQKTVRHHLATHLTGPELHRLRNLFSSIDKSGTGFVSIEALGKVLSEDSHLGGLDVKSFDLGGDGMVDWREFVAGAMQQHELSNADNLEKVFAELDKDNNGTLCVKEVAATLGDDAQLARELLATVGDGDAVMTLAEFKEHMRSKAPVEAAPNKKRRDPKVGSTSEMV